MTDDSSLADMIAAGPAGERRDSHFNTAMAHLYRGEMHRMTVWRQRLDVTSNWAILLTMGLTTFTLGSPQVPHYTLLLGLALIAMSILIEARRYRHLHHSKWRLYVMECGFFAELLDAREGEVPKWRSVLAADLRRPRFTVSWYAATRVRLRRNYLFLLYFVTGVWFTKLFVHPASPATIGEFHSRLAVGGLIPSPIVLVTAVVFVVAATLLSAFSPSQEKLESWTELCRHSSARV